MPALTGHCLCGAVRFEIDEPLMGASYCHCTRCRRRTGTAASPNGYVPAGSLRFVAGEELTSAWVPEDGWAKQFCSVCGSSLFSYDSDDPERRAVRLGVIDGDPGIRPTHRQYVANAAVWEPVPEDGLPQHPGATPRS
jgi:hypothetical protein